MNTEAYLQRLSDETDRSYDEARRKIDEARKELNEIEHQLIAGYNGHPWKRPGRIEGVDAGAVFGAAAAIENLATAKRQLVDEPKPKFAEGDLVRVRTSKTGTVMVVREVYTDLRSSDWRYALSAREYTGERTARGYAASDLVHV